MVKSGLGLFAGRRKSSGNAFEEVEPMSVPDVAAGAESGSGGFRLMSTAEAEARKKDEKRRAQEKASKFRPFSGFSAGSKGRNHSFDEESPASSKRDSKSSSGTQSSRYYNGQFGSTSTLPSSADADSNDNIFANVPRPHMTQHNSSPNPFPMSAHKKQLPAIPRSETRAFGETASPPPDVSGIGRVRAMTSSSYASTAKAPTLDADLNFGSNSFDDLFSGLDRKPSPDYNTGAPGRSLLEGKRAFHAEPIKIDRKLDVEAPPKSWDSRGSTDNLMSSPRSVESNSPPPPVPPHKYSSNAQYAPVASHSPDLAGSNEFEDTDAKIVRRSAMPRKSVHESSPEQKSTSLSSSAPSVQTPLSSRSTSNNATPKAALRASVASLSNDEDNIFSSPKQNEVPSSKPAPVAPMQKQNRPVPPPSGDSGRKVMTQAEFRAQQQRQMMQPQDMSSDEEDYEDEEDAEERAAQEAIARRKKQQMDLARETMRRATTAPARPDSVQEPFSMGFPSETSLQADEWEDEDVPLGILAQHGFPNAGKGKAPAAPANAIPSFFRTSTPTLPERPASAGAMSNRASQGFKPPFARGLPDDPHASFIGGGLIRPSNRESLGMNFNRGPSSVAGDPMGGMSMSMPMMGYPEPQLSAPSLVEQIHMRDQTKQKYMGGASSKKQPQQGPFTGLLGAQMNGPNQSNPQTRMSQMPMMNGMNGMNNMNGMNGMGQMMNMNMMGAPMGMSMGMNGMAYPMQQNDMMHMQQMQQMQQMLAAQQLQIQQMQAMSQQQPQDPRMSMAFPNNFGGNGLLNVPGGLNAQRPMSVMSTNNQPPRPFSTGNQMSNGFLPTPPAPLNGYTPSIAPSERSNIGLSARYRPVATHQDATSTVSSMTLQANGSTTQNKTTVKGILKNKSSPMQEDDEDGWGQMAARKSKFVSNGFSNNKDEGDLRELVRGVEGL